MNTKKYVLSVLGVFIFLSLYGWQLHGHCLKDLYIETAQFWRPEEMMRPMISFIYLANFIFSLLFCFIYTKGLEGGGSIGQGLKYGILMGFIIHLPLSITRFVYLPYPTNLQVYWLIGGIVGTVLAGLVVGLIYRKETL